MIALGMLLTGLGFGAFGIALTGIGMAGAVVVWTFGEMFGSPGAAASSRTEHRRTFKGGIRAASGMTYALAFTIGPIGGRRCTGGARGLWIVCAALGLIGAALALTGEAVSRTPLAEPPPGCAPRPLGYISKSICRDDISARYDEGKLEHARTRGPGPPQGAIHARLPALA